MNTQIRASLSVVSFFLLSSSGYLIKISENNFTDMAFSTLPKIDTTITLIEEKLNVSIRTHEHYTGNQMVNCLSYVTSGYEKVGQKELVFTMVYGKKTEKPYPAHSSGLF